MDFDWSEYDTGWKGWYILRKTITWITIKILQIAQVMFKIKKFLRKETNRVNDFISICIQTTKERLCIHLHPLF